MAGGLRSACIVGIALVGGLAAMLGGCIESRLVACGDGRACPVGTTCAIIEHPGASDGAPHCVASDQLTACAGANEHDACGDAAACYPTTAGLVCLPAHCGNGLVDPQLYEVCDDANTVSGDGCAFGCQSNETCGNGVLDVALDEQCDDKNFASHDGCSSRCTLEQRRVDTLAIGQPSARGAPSMVYDSKRDRIVLFGGAFNTQSSPSLPRNDTWEFDGRGWRQVSTRVSPTARFGAAMAYDSHRERVVLFGGSGDNFERLGDTWEFDGVTWIRRVPAAAPSARAFAAAVYDPIRRRTVLFGGASNTELGETWEWDGETWTQVDGPLQPAPRIRHSMAYDPIRGRIMMVGGVAVVGTPADTWEYDGTWHYLGPCPYELRHGPAIGLQGTSMIASGSDGSQMFTYRWSNEGWQHVSAAQWGGAGRMLVGFARDPLRDQLIVMGGTAMFQPMSFSDTWAWNGAVWYRVNTARWPSVTDAAATFDARRRCTVMFGGADGENLSGAAFAMCPGHVKQLAVGPSARKDAAMAYDVVRDEVVLFGGSADGSYLADTWILQAEWSQRSLAVSPPAGLGAMAYDARRRVIVLVVDEQTWEWDGQAWNQRTPEPHPTGVGSLAYDPIRQRIVFHATVRSQSLTWEWDGMTWTQGSSMLEPPGAIEGALAWNAPRRTLERFGGIPTAGAVSDDAWERVDTEWRPLFIAPPARAHHVMTPLADGSGLAILGGLDIAGVLSSEHWTVRLEGDTPDESCATHVDIDGDGLAGCADPDCWYRCTPHCPPGIECDTTQPRCGDGVCNADLENCRLCAEDCQCDPVCGDHYCDPGESCVGDCN